MHESKVTITDQKQYSLYFVLMSLEEICKVRKSSQQSSCLQGNSEKIPRDENGNIYKLEEYVYIKFSLFIQHISLHKST